jgi:hypothetical protein
MDSPDYRTPRAGEGFQTEIFGRQITVHPNDRRSTSSIDIGMQLNVRGADNKGGRSFRGLYFWRHPDDNELFRPDVVWLYNEVFFSRTFKALTNLNYAKLLCHRS